MKAITVRQPWAWAMAEGYKDVENKGTMPPRALLGQRFAICAGRAYADGANAFIEGLGLELPPSLWFGCVIGVARLVGVFDASTRRVVTQADGYAGTVPAIATSTRWIVPGWRYGWVVVEAVALEEQIDVRGWPGVFDLPADVEARVVAQLRSAA